MRSLTALLVPALAASTHAQSLDYVFDAAASTITLDTRVSLDFNGDLRGVFDAATNPSGTRTIAGIFGDNGLNARIPLSLGLEVGLDLGGLVAGGFSLELDTLGGTAELSGFDVTLSPPGGGAAGGDLTLVLQYGTFRTVNPGSVFIGGIPLPLPLGSVDVTNVRIVQSGPAPGVLLPAPAGPVATFQLNALVPAELSFDVALGGILGGGGGGTTPVGPLPIAVPVSWTLDLADCGARVEGSASESLSQSIPSPLPLELEDIPLPLPTLLPPGGTADLLLSVSLDTLGIEGSLSSDLAASAGSAARFTPICGGEQNSVGPGAAIEPIGTPSLLAGDFGLRVTGLPPGRFGMLIMSPEADFVPGFGGNKGTLCLGLPCFRLLDTVAESSPLGESAVFPDPANLPMGQMFVPGERWNFQYWYRDVNPGSTSNLSGALGVLFCN